MGWPRSYSIARYVACLEYPPLADMPFFTRLSFAWRCFFRVLFDGVFAERFAAVCDSAAKLPSGGASGSVKAAKTDEAVRPAATEDDRRDGALQLLALFQREGRLVD